MEVTNGVSTAAGGAQDAADAPESEQTSDGLLSQDKQELSERVAHLEKRTREQGDEIVCVKGALADVMRRLGQLETAKAHNSILPSKPFSGKSPRRNPSGHERPKSTIEVSRGSVPSSARQSPRGASATQIKKWNSMSNSIEETNGHKTPRSSHNTPLSQSNQKKPAWDVEDKYLKIYLKGRPVPLYAPSNTEGYSEKAKQDPPASELSLEWVYGYRGRDCRSNLHMLPTGEVLYFAAAVVVLHNFEEQTQRHYLEHTDDVKCVAVHPDQVRVASGQVAGHERKEGKPHVRVWNSVSLQTLHVIGEGEFQRGVCCVSFSIKDGGKHLLAVDEGNDHILSIWDVSKDNKFSKITECKTSGDPVTQCEFSPAEENSIVCCGKSQISFWTFEGKKLNKRAGIFEKNEKPKVVICFAFTENGDVVSGDSNGNMYVWGKGGNKITQAITGAHEGGVFSLCVLKKEDEEDVVILSGGGKDRKIIEWDKSFEKTGKEVELPECSGAVRMITKGSGSMLYVGTIRNGILQGNFDMEFSPIVEGHKEEVWGLDTQPGSQQFMTCGYDRYIYLWDSQSHRCVWSKEICDPAHCCSFHPTFDVAAIGLQTGKVILVDLNTHLKVGAVYKDGAEQIECIQYSADGTMLAAGCRDNYIYLYEVTDDGNKLHNYARCSGHSSYVTHIDWSSNGEVIRSNSGDYEVLYWRAKNGKQETSKDDVRDLEWATQNCTLSFNSIGVWPDGADGTDINNCSTSHERKDRLIVSADDYGKVNLLVYPSIQPLATGHSYPGHSSHVTSAKFLFDDSRVLSTGGRDTTVIQWQVV